jgi:hypothetical protein
MWQRAREDVPKRRRALGNWAGLGLAAVALLSVAARTPFDAPPRFDGAGYAVLAEALRQGLGYRAIDHPDRPTHGHYPPGYPLVLASLWRITGTSVRAAHVLSLVLTATAVSLYYSWMRRRAGTSMAIVLGLALAVNWVWGRTGGGIQSEPLFFCLTGLALHAFDWSLQGRRPRGVVLGIVLGATILTRHAGAMMALALLGELLIRRRRRLALASAGASLLVVVPWLLCLGRAGQTAQHELIGRGGLMSVAGRQILFYLQRIPDQITGPIVEVGTVFRPELAPLALAWAVAVSGIIFLGWIHELRSTRWRLAGMIPLATLGLLFVWPFSEAGRFLIPLVPFLLLGLWHGLERSLRMIRPWPGRRRWIAAVLVLVVSLPYSVYALASHRLHEVERTHSAFDAACRWIACQPGARPVLARQGGEAFWLMGRTRPAFAPPLGASPTEIGELIERYGAEFLILDPARYAHSETNPLDAYVSGNAESVEEVFARDPVRVYRVRARGAALPLDAGFPG